MDKFEKIRLIKSLIVPFIMVFVIWTVKLFEVYSHINLHFLGVLPLKVAGLIGIITAPLIHADFNHLLSNTFALFFLTTALFYFYKEIAAWAFFSIYILSGFWVWFFGRDAYHIGASGIIYGLVAFLFFSGIFRKHKPLVALSLTIVFLYGSIIWGIFPLHASLSWETHLTGLIAGLIMAVYYKNEGPQKPIYQWEEEAEDDDVSNTDISLFESNETPVDKTDDFGIDVKYHYKERE